MPIMRGCAVNPGRCGNVRNAPCKGCQEREIACHTRCGRYKDFCVRNEQAKERKKVANASNYRHPERPGERTRFRWDKDNRK